MLECLLQLDQRKTRNSPPLMIRRYAPLLCTIALLGLLISPAAPSSANPSDSKKTLRVMTFNIHVGVGMDKKLDLQRIADVIIRERADLVGLQEVDRGVRRTEAIDEIAELAKMTRMDYAFGHNLDYQEGQYGVAILSKFLIRKIDHRRYENRVRLNAEVCFELKLISGAARSILQLRI